MRQKNRKQVIDMNNDREKDINLYADEARERWSDTEAYRESEKRTAGYTKKDWSELSAGLDEIIKGFSELKRSGVLPEDHAAASQVERLRSFITARLYTCTDEILAGLGAMYVNDERFKKNIDRCGEGTAEYISACVSAYLLNNAPAV